MSHLPLRIIQTTETANVRWIYYKIILPAKGHVSVRGQSSTKIPMYLDIWYWCQLWSDHAHLYFALFSDDEDLHCFWHTVVVVQAENPEELLVQASPMWHSRLFCDVPLEQEIASSTFRTHNYRLIPSWSNLYAKGKPNSWQALNKTLMSKIKWDSCRIMSLYIPNYRMQSQRFSPQIQCSCSLANVSSAFYTELFNSMSETSPMREEY